MMILYKQGFSDFTPVGIRAIRRYLFGDIYDWVGQYRIINIAKREKLLAGQSVWYSNDEDIPRELETVFQELRTPKWDSLPCEEFVRELARHFAKIWQIHPFREGNTRTVVMMMTFFVEYYDYYMDQDLMAASAGYVRDSFVMASLGRNSEYQHMEKILLDAVCDELISYSEEPLEHSEPSPAQVEKYQRYQKEDYTPQPHYQREDS